MRGETSSTIVRSPKLLSTFSNSATSLPERSPASTASLTLPDALAPRGALLAQVLQALHAAFVARAPRLDALADPDFLLRPEPVELAVGEVLGARQLRLALLVGRKIAREQAQPPRSSSTMRVATRSRKARSWVMTMQATSLQQLFQHQDAVDVQVVGRLVEQQQVGLQREGEGERGALALAAGDLGGRRVGVHREAVQEFGRAASRRHGDRARRHPCSAPRSSSDSRTVGARAAGLLLHQRHAQSRLALHLAVVERMLPASTPSSDDLPVPLRPMSPRRSPAEMASDAQSSSGVRPNASSASLRAINVTMGYLQRIADSSQSHSVGSVTVGPRPPVAG